MNVVTEMKYVDVNKKKTITLRRQLISSYKTIDIPELIPQLRFYEPPLFGPRTLRFFAPQRLQQPQQPTTQGLLKFSEWQK